MRLSHEQVIEEKLEKFCSLSRVSTPFKSELKQRQKYKWGHNLVKELSRIMHQVALFSDAAQHVEELLCHEVRLVVTIESIHAVLDYITPQL